MSGFADVCKIILLYSYYTAVQINNSLAEDTIFVGFVLGFFCGFKLKQSVFD